MKRIRFTIASLLVVVLFVAVGFAALREASEIWDSGLFSLMLGVLLISILFAVHRHESKRAFWLGFAIFGWIYVGLSLVPSVEPRLITTKALTYLDSNFITGQIWGNVPDNQKEHTIAAPFEGFIVKKRNQDGLLMTYYTSLLAGGGGTTENFVRIGNSLLTLFMAWLGGQLSRYIYTKNRQGNLGRETSAGVDLE